MKDFVRCAFMYVQKGVCLPALYLLLFPLHTNSCIFFSCEFTRDQASASASRTALSSRYPSSARILLAAQHLYPLLPGTWIS